MVVLTQNVEEWSATENSVRWLVQVLDHYQHIIFSSVAYHKSSINPPPPPRSGGLIYVKPILGREINRDRGLII